MSVIRGKYLDGKVILDAPADWPDGSDLRVECLEDESDLGIREEDWPRDSAGIQALLQQIDAIEPWLTPEEEAEWKKAMAEQKNWELAHAEEQFQKLEKLFK